MVKKGNPWIPIADLFSSVVLVVLLLFVMASISPKYTAEQKRVQVMHQFTAQLNDYEAKGQLRVYVDKSILEFTSVTFASGSALLTEDTSALVRDLAVKLKQSMLENPALEVLIEGHTDPAVVRATINRGGYFQNNIQLSALRAINVREGLLQHMGQEFASRIGVAGYGETRLKNTEDVYSADNRRIEIRLLWEGRDGKKGTLAQ